MAKIKFGARCTGMNQTYIDEFEVDNDTSDEEIEFLVKEQAIQATSFEFWWEKL